MTDDTRSKLVKTAMRAMYSSGYESVGVASITEQARIPKGSFYYWFSSKEELGGEVIGAFSDASAALRARSLDDDGRPPLERLARYFRHTIKLLEQQNFETGCLLGNLTLEMSGRSEPMRTRLTAAFERWEGALRNVLAEAHAAHELPEGLSPEEAAAFILNTWEGALLRMRATRSGLPLQLFMDFVFKRFLAFEEVDEV